MCGDLADAVAAGFAGDQQAREAGGRRVLAVVPRHRAQHVHAAAALAQAQVADHQVGRVDPARDGRECAGLVGRRADVAAPFGQQGAQAFEDAGFIVDHQHPQAADIERQVGVRRVPRGGIRRRGGQRQRDAGPAARAGTERDPATQQVAKLAHGGQAQAQAALALAIARRRRRHLVELLEHLRLVFGRDAAAAVPDIDANLPRVLVADAEQHAPGIGVAQRIADQVVEDPGEHGAVGAHPGVGLADHQAQPA